MTGVVIETERMVMRHWRPGDLELWLEHLNTPAVTEHLGGVRTREMVEERFAKLVASWAEEGFSFLAVDLRPCGTFLGTCGINRISNPGAPDSLTGQIQIGWQFRADFWGKGYATEAARSALVLAFDHAGLDMVYAQTAFRNRASWGIMEKLGMTRRPEMDYIDSSFPEQDNPTILYTLTRNDWSARQAS